MHTHITQSQTRTKLDQASILPIFTWV